MRHSIYIQLATLLIKADLKREQNAWLRKVRRSQYELPFHSEHLLRDIGLDSTGRPLGESLSVTNKAERRVTLMRRIFRTRLST
ncbi:MAG TPA: DUF1127 domain-containing protein [Vibrio sp.]|uniref:DUF1127 domain-containing protein n=1 Tax=Vibrio TaxID=662 RepID=UPI000ECFD849|nr:MULTISPECIES: DUF1127 domain-containing protein [Vibrio]MCF7355215.1 DUF1127 domain-containing protein [Vibrio sp. CK2-1]HCH03174.1 DUF1127 domain-containing protein [Vibrio sp.]